MFQSNQPLLTAYQQAKAILWQYRALGQHAFSQNCKCFARNRCLIFRKKWGRRLQLFW